MNEEEIINIVKDYVNHNRYDDKPKYSEKQWFMAIEDLLYMYSQEKEKNKIIENAFDKMAKDIKINDIPDIFYFHKLKSAEGIKNYYLNYDKAKEVEKEYYNERNHAFYESEKNYYKKLKELGIEFDERGDE